MKYLTWVSRTVSEPGASFRRSHKILFKINYFGNGNTVLSTPSVRRRKNPIIKNIEFLLYKERLYKERKKARMIISCKILLCFIGMH